MLAAVIALSSNTVKSGLDEKTCKHVNNLKLGTIGIVMLVIG